MEQLFERHNTFISQTPMEFVREIMYEIQWNSRLIVIKGPKGVGKSTLMLQYIKLNYNADDKSVLYCSADSTYFATHSLFDTIRNFSRHGGKRIFIDEIHKYENWSREIKEAYDLYKDLHIVISGSSLIEINNGYADLSRRAVPYNMFGLSFREFLWFDAGVKFKKVSLESLISKPNQLCMAVLEKCRPLEFFERYMMCGYYPFYFEDKPTIYIKIEGMMDYVISSELTANRGLEVGNIRKVKALLQVLSHMVPYDVDIKKLSGAVGIERATVLKYLAYLEESKLIRRLYADLKNITSLQKPDKILLDNSNILYTLSDSKPQTGTVRETFFCNQMEGSGHKTEYCGKSGGDYKIDDKIVFEIGGRSKNFSQIYGIENGYLAVDDMDFAKDGRIPLWAFGFLY